MLFELLDQLEAQISGLDIQTEAPVMLEQITQARPDFLPRLKEGCKKGGAKEEVIPLFALGIACRVLGLIKEIPQIADVMIEEVRKKRSNPNLRCALAGVLAYLVQPRDLLPDDAPGGYGFVDDCILLRMGLKEYLHILPASLAEAEKEGENIQILGSIVPLQLVPALQLAIQGMSMTFQILRLLPSQLVEWTTQQTIANPLQMSAPQPPPGFQPAPAPGIGGGHWSGGAYFEGGNVICPGGASLIDGQLFIPT